MDVDITMIPYFYFSFGKGYYTFHFSFLVKCLLVIAWLLLLKKKKRGKKHVHPTLHFEPKKLINRNFESS